MTPILLCASVVWRISKRNCMMARRMWELVVSVVIPPPVVKCNFTGQLFPDVLIAKARIRQHLAVIELFPCYVANYWALFSFIIFKEFKMGTEDTTSFNDDCTVHSHYCNLAYTSMTIHKLIPFKRIRFWDFHWMTTNNCTAFLHSISISMADETFSRVFGHGLLAYWNISISSHWFYKKKQTKV